MEILDIQKMLNSLLNYKIAKTEINELKIESLSPFIDDIIIKNNAEIDLEIFAFTGGKLHNVEEYYEEYRNQKLAPLSGKHYQLLLENNLLQKFKTYK